LKVASSLEGDCTAHHDDVFRFYEQWGIEVVMVDVCKVALGVSFTSLPPS
jgi:hypothetical protein